MAESLSSTALAPESQTRPDTRTGLSVIVPLFNESECVGSLVEMLAALDKEMCDRYRFEFVFVDDASTDDTVERLASAAAARLEHQIVRHPHNRGIAGAIATGLTVGTEDLAASIDADASYDPAVLADLEPLVTNNVTMATASPYHPDGRVLNLPAWRIALSRMASRVYSVVMPQRLTCYTCCVRVYDRKKVLECTVQNDGFVGVAELAWEVLRRGGRIAEAPAVLRPRQAGVSKMRTASATIDHLQLIARIARQRLLTTFRAEPPDRRVSTRRDTTKL